MATAINTGGASALPFIHPDDMPATYALTGVGTCMEPLVTDGEVLVFDKSRAPEIGDVVGLILTRPAASRWGTPGMVKQLGMALPPAGVGGLVVVDQINPCRRYAIPASDLLAVHKCVGVGVRDGDGTVRLVRSIVCSEVM